MPCSVDALRKDIGLIGDAARGASLPTDHLDVVDALYARASATGDGAQDMARLVTVLDRPA